MDSSIKQTGHSWPPKRSGLWNLRGCTPFLLLFVSLGYGLITASLQLPEGLLSPSSFEVISPTVSGTSLKLRTEYLIAPLEQVLEKKLWQKQRWQPAPSQHSGIGYLDGPVTFRVTVENPGTRSVKKWAVISAPYLDRIRPAILKDNGFFERLAEMGDLYPFSNRLIELPQWIWPVTLPPGTHTLLFEVQNAGPSLLPIAILEPEAVISNSAETLVWKAFITGLLAFALLFNLSIMLKFRRPGLAWLSVLLLSIIYTQLVMEGFGLWFLWPNQPAMNALLNTCLPLCLIALCQFTPHFIVVSKTSRRALNVISALAFLYLLAIPINAPLLGQGSFLLLAMTGGAVILGLVMRKFQSHASARYFAFSILAILLGSLISALRTIGWVPVNSLTDSAFFLGAAAASLILTSGVGRQMLEERKKRMSSDSRARQEQQLRTVIEQDYDRLLKTHSVTGKPNRAMLEESLDALDSRQHPYTVGLIQLVRFNEIEQALGYRTAEDLLKNYLRQLNSFLKRILGERLVMINGYALASIDISNHAFAFHRSDSPGSDTELLQELMAWLDEHYREGRFSFSWSPSVGIAHAPEHGEDASGILSSAGFASLDSRQPLTVYDPAVAEWQYQQQMLMLDIEEALRNGDIWLEYQPKVNIRDARVSSMEALIRWQHPEFGTVPPDNWIPLAEQVGMIHPVTLWVIDRACRDHHDLRSVYGDGIAVAVNISAKDLSHPVFNEEVESITRRHGMEPSDLILEITETAMMADASAARKMIRTLSQTGFRIALDDFGTGHSSLATLATFELDELKIDRSFLKGILHYPVPQRIFRAALDLGEALDLDVVVEGVEDEAVAAWLLQFPGLHGQGYYWGRPEKLVT
ncbi:diguanylate phosphodiesterase [Marinobacter salinus]|uniref:Diguanylate phosphodiesterase n=1 Tax=Marinobacter salinus TaxID=1874317 RepID=A0A1D9GQB6_9GAMM|nr:EAL domain-containing protein [Marinobacter salinus]AOY89711.1 diguanylate phosphodiesterase [Marinobacter salinus]